MVKRSPLSHVVAVAANMIEKLAALPIAVHVSLALGLGACWGEPFSRHDLNKELYRRHKSITQNQMDFELIHTLMLHQELWKKSMLSKHRVSMKQNTNFKQLAWTNTANKQTLSP